MRQITEMAESGFPPRKRPRKISEYFSRVPSADNVGTSTDREASGGDSTTISATVRESTGTTVSATVNFNPTFVTVSSGAARQPSTQSFPSDIAQSNSDQPVQPVINFPTTLIGGRPRSFQVSWFQQYQWLEYSLERDSCYCYPCRLFSRDPSDSAFVNPNGYSDWKHAPGKTGSLYLHASSTAHSSAMVVWQQFKLNRERKTTLAHRMDSLGEQTLQINRHYIKTIAEVILLCARQDIALRGHDESDKSENPGNFKAILHLIANHDDQFQLSYRNAPRNALYTSPDIQNQLASIMSNMVREVICTQVRDAVYFSLLVDETKDISKKEQMSIVLRYLQNSKVYERFIGFVHISSLDAASLVEYICDTMSACHLSLDNCVSQCYDGASVMSGACSGVQARIREIAPCAIYTHCCAHRLNLVLVDCFRCISYAGEFLAQLESLYVFMSASKAHELFLEKQTLLRPGKQVIQLKRLVETRWACRHMSIVAVRQTFGAILATLNAIALSTDHDRSIQAQGILCTIQCFQFVVCLVIFDYLFGLTKGLSDALQSPDLDLAAAVCLISSVESTLSESRSDTSWSKLWDEATKLAMEYKITIPRERSSRQCGVPRRLDDYILIGSSLGHRDDLTSKDDYCYHLYYAVIDNMLGEMNKRFSESNKEIMKAIQSCSPKSENYLDFEALKPLVDLYSSKLPSEDSLKLELVHAANVVKQTNPNAKTNMDTIAVLTPLKPAFPGILQLLNIVQTIAVTSSSCERTFSSLKRIKTYLRSTMGDERLSSLSVLSIERDLSSDIQMSDVLDNFANSNRRILL